jgi:hypothetical protein
MSTVRPAQERPDAQRFRRPATPVTREPQPEPVPDATREPAPTPPRDPELRIDLHV